MPPDRHPEFSLPLYSGELDSISELYHENTKLSHSLTDQWPPRKSDKNTFRRMTQAFKMYPDAAVIALTQNFGVGSCSLEEAIETRRSCREFAHEPLTIDDLSKLLHFANGITAVNVFGDIRQPLRAAPSAGALYPIEIYPVILNVVDLAAGVYHFNVRSHSLDTVVLGDFVEECYGAFAFTDWVRRVPALFILTAIFPRSTSKYKERGYRFVLLDAGHIGQNIYLMAASMRLGVVSLGGFFDDELNDLLGVDGVNEAAVYALAVGHREVDHK